MLLMACMIVPWVTNAQDVFNFENGVIPAGWTNSTTYPWVVTSTSQDNGHNGTYCIKSGNSGVGSSTSSISATFTLVTDGSISFLGGIYGEGTSTVWDKCIFEIDGVQQFSYGALAAWATYTFPLTAGQHTFTWKYSKDGSVNPTGDAFFVDDVVVEGTSIPDCYPVRNLAIIDSLTTSESITLTWSDPNNSAATYNVYRIVGTDTTLLTNVSDTSITIDTLQPMTPYTFAVETDCGNDGASVMRVISGRTACVALTEFPWSENFEAYPAGDLAIPCWTNEHISGSGTSVFQIYTYTNAENATHQLQLPDMNSGTQTKLVLPLMDFDGDEYLFSIDVYRNASGTSYPSEGVRIYASTDGNIEGATEMGFLYRNCSQTDGRWVTAETTTGWYTYEIPIPFTGTGYIILRGESSWGSSTYMDNFAVVRNLPCKKVMHLAVIDSMTTTESLTLTWMDTLNDVPSYTIYRLDATDSVGVFDTVTVATGITDTFYTVMSLDANTDYTFAVAADCGSDGLSNLVYVSGHTGCLPISELPYTMSFEEEDIIGTNASIDMFPWCWTRINTLTSGYNYYPYSYAYNPNTGNRALYFYASSYGTYADTTGFILPELDVTTYPMSENRLTFWAKVTSTSYPFNCIVVTMGNPADRSTYTVIDTVTVDSTTYTKYSVSLAEADDTQRYVAVIVPRVYSTMYMDDVTLEPIPSCADVMGITLDSTDATSAYLSWNSNGADSYEVEVRQDTIVLTDTDIDVTITDDTTVVISGLVMDGDYQVYVRAMCGSDAGIWSLPVRVHIGYCLPDPQSVDGSGITSISSAYATSTTHPTSAPFYGNYYNTIIDSVPAGVDGTLNITYSTGYTYGTIIWIDFDNSLTFDTNEVVYRGESTNSNPTTLTATYHIPSTVEPGVYRMRIAGADSFFDNAVAGTEAPEPCFTSTWSIAEDYSIEILDAPECMPVEYFTYVDSLTAGHTATFLWTSDAGSFQVEYKKTTEQDWTIETVSDTIVTLTGLDASSAYMIRVKALCGSDESLYSNVINFTTTVACPAPANLRAVLTPGDGTTATLAWTDPTGSAWQICFNGDTNYIDVTDSSSFTFDTLTPEQTYTAKVRRNCTDEQEGYSTWSSMITFVPTDAYSLIVNDGTTTNGYVPIYGYYVDNHTQSRFIIPASALSQIEFGIINKLVFHASTASAPWTGASFEVYMTETDATTVSSVVSTDDMDQVYTGSLSIVGNKMEVNFSTPYQYMGGNLMIAFEQPTSGTFTSCSWYGITANGASMGGYGSSVSQRNFLPKTTIYYTPGVEPTCFPVSNLMVIDSMTTTESITVTWEDTINTSATYDVYVVNGTDTTAYTASDNVYTIENLQHSTEYTIIVAANCGSDAAIARSVVARTACAAVTDFPWSEDFENYAAGNLEINCWENVHISGGGSQIFKIYTSTINGNATHKLQLPDMTSGTQTKLALPTMELQEGTRYMFSIDINRNATGTSSTSEGVRVFVSTNGEIAGAHELGFLYRNYTQTDGGVVHAESASGWYTYDFIIPDSISGNVNIILRGESTYGSSTYMDNLVVMVAPQCLQPAGVSVSDIDETSATIHIDDPEENGSYHVVLLNGADTVLNEVVSDTVLTIDTLTSSTSYSVIVTAVCDDSTETRAVSATFRTPCTSITVFPWTETFEAADLGCWTSEGQGQWTIGAGISSSYSATAYQGQSNAKITHTTRNDVTKLVSPVFDAGSDAGALLLTFAHIQGQWGSDIDAHRVLYRTSATGNWVQAAEYTQAIASWTVDQVMLPGDIYQIAFEFTDNYGYGVGIDSVVIASAGDYCFPVVGLAVESTTENTVTLTWSSDAASFTVMNDSVQVATGITDTFYTVTGLTASTGYTFSVIADCSPTSSSAPSSITAMTACLGGGCSITIVGTDAYGDGWNGGYIDIVQNGVSIAHCTVTDQGLDETPITETYTYQVCSGSPVTFLWNSGDYDDEVSFVIKNANDSVLYTVSNAETLTDGAVFYTATNPCAGYVPDTFYVTLSSANATMGTVSPAGSTAVAEGHTFTATATPATNHIFTGWVNAAGDTVSTANPYTFTVTVDITLTGTFAYNGVGIEAVSFDNVTLFPNPASTSVTLSGLEAKAMVTLVDVNGHVSGQWKAEGNTLTIDLTNYATGTYFVRIVGEQAVAVRKLIIK